ncbi:hypothetical protein [Myroides odoratus]|uniref:Phage MuF C-terminal domain-containing protein n=1 Tax=Myroides odoratus TaxID=256 RepID=A0A378RMV3_MYROD|nr:hypothetical protein [Myroides odoratus]QQU04215.1 hypothetical protein I6I89_02715 [Myroides odoratus]STZ28372.1 Uncharacterised protein [Myroides odoratus]
MDNKKYSYNGKEYSYSDLQSKYGDKTDQAISKFGFKEVIPEPKYTFNGKEYSRSQLQDKYGDRTDEAISKFGFEQVGSKKKDISASSTPQQSLESNSGNGSSVSQNNKVINQSNSKITKLAQDTESAKVVSNEKIKEITQSVDDEINQVGIINNTKAYAKKGFNKLIDGILTITPLHDSERVAFKNRFGLEESPLSDELKEIKKQEQDEIILAKKENRPARTLTDEERISKARQLKIDKRIKSESDSQVRAFMKDAENNIDEYGVSDKDKLLIYNKSKEQSISYKDKDLLKRADLFSKVVLNTENEIKEVRDSFRNGKMTKDEAQSKLDFLNRRRNNSIAEGIRNLEEFNSKDDELGTVKDNIDLLKRNYNWITNITRSVDAGVDKMASGIIDSGRWLNEIVGQDQYSADNIMFMSMSNDFKKSYQAKTESLMKPISVDDIDFDSEHLLSDFGSYASTLLGQQLPIMAAVLTGAPGIASLGFSSAGEKYDEMIMEEAKGEENYSHTQKTFAPLGYGLSETGSALIDRMIMMNTSRVIRAATSLEKKEIAKGFAKNVFIKPTLHTLKSTAIEGLEEGATEIAQNLIDIYFLDKKDVDVYDNVKDAVVAGGLMGGAMSSPALVFSPYGSIRNSIERFSTEQNLRQAQNIVFKLSEALNSDNISETEFGIIKDQFDKATIKTIDIAKTEASKIAQLSNDEFNAINEIERGKKEIKSKAQEILDGELSQELKDEVLKGLKDEYSTLENQRIGILNRDSNALLNLLPQEEVIRLKDEASRELMQEKNPDGTKNITIEDKEISERALENYIKQSLPNETVQTEDIVDDGNIRPSNEQLDSVQGEFENGKKGDNQTQEIQYTETAERPQVIKASDNGREYTISNEEGRIVFKDRDGNTPSKRTSNRLALEYAKQTNLTEGKRAHEVEGVIDSSELANMTVKEANKFIAEKSESPIEIAETILGNEIEDYRNGVDYKQKVIAENLGHVSRESFIQNSDEVHAKEGGSIPIQYLRKDGTPLDTKAKELSEIAGIEITEQDIVDFILENPTGSQTFLNNGFHSDINSLKARFEELTGLPATNEVIQEIVNQNERKLQLQEQMTSIDFMSDEELLHLLNQREQYEQETANASTKGVREIADSKNNEGESRVQQDGSRENQGTESSGSREAEGERVNLPKSTFNKLVQTFQKFFGAGNVHSDSNKLAKVLGQDPNSVFFQKQWEGINDTFNSELEQLQKGTLPKGHIFQLGSPTRILQAAGIPNLPIELAASRLKDKSKQDNHPFELSDIKDLAIAVQNPLAVFDSSTQLGSFVVLTELTHNGKNFIAAIEANKKKELIEINDIRSVYPRNNMQIVSAINDNLTRYADKQKMREWFSKQRFNSAEVKGLFSRASNLVQKFENPKVNDVDFQVDYKKLASDNKYTQPKVPTQNIFFNDVEVLNRETENMVGKLVDEGKNVSVQSVDVVNIIPTQKNVNINNLKEVQDVRDRPLLFKQGDKYYVIDGHHRISNEILEGEKKVEADVYDADVQFMQTPDGTIWGATFLNEQGQREIYINESALSPETLLHEVYHPFDDMMKQASENSDVHALVAIGRLDKLAKENGYLEAVQSNPNYANKPLEQQQAEARVQMIGEIGNKQLDKSFYEKLEAAVIDAIEWLAKQFGVSLKNYSPEQIINLKLEDIVKASLASAQKGEFETKNTSPVKIKDNIMSELESGKINIDDAISRESEILSNYNDVYGKDSNQVSEQKKVVESLKQFKSESSKPRVQFSISSKVKDSFDKLNNKINKSIGRDLTLSLESSTKANNEVISKVKRLWNNTFKSSAGLSSFNKQNVDFFEIIKGLERSESSVIDGLKYETKQFKLILSKIGNKDTLKVKNAKLRLVNDYMSGMDVDLSFLDAETISQIDFFRSRIDNLSNNIIGVLLNKASKLEDSLSKQKENSLTSDRIKESIINVYKVIEKIEDNKGKYITRSYQAFLDNKYIDRLTVSRSNMSESNRKKIDKAVEYLINEEGLSKKEAETSIYEYLDTIKKGFDSKGYASSNNGAAKAPFLKKRKDLSKEFRELLGEVQEPLYNYINTIYSMSNYLSSLTYQEKLLEGLTNSGVGSYESISGYTKLSSNSENWTVLSDLYVPNEFAQALNDIQPEGRIKEDWARVLVGLTAIAKVGKTVWSPTTTARNVLSGVFLGVNSGHLTYNAKYVSKALNQAFSAKSVFTEANAKQLRAELIEQGVINDGVNSGELRATLNDFKRNIDRLVKTNAIEKSAESVQTLYAFGDDFYKVIGYLTEKQRFVKSGMSETEAATKAGYRIRGGYPTYSYLSPMMKKLRRFPLMGTFVSFPYETVRSTKNNALYVLEDLRDGRISMAMKRLAGMIVASALPAVLSVYTRSLIGWSDDDEQALRKTLPDWQRNSLLIYSGIKDGEPSFFDATALFPSEVWLKPIMTAIGQRKDYNSALEQLSIGMDEFLSPYYDADLTVKMMTELYSNKNQYEQKIYESDNLFEAIFKDPVKVTNHIMKGAGPGVYNNISEFARANDIMPEFFGDKITSYGREYTNEDALLALAGFRFSTINFYSSMLYMGYDLKDDSAKVRYDLAKKEKRKKAFNEEEITDIISDYNKGYSKVEKDLTNMINTARKLNMSESKIQDAISTSFALSKSDYQFYLQTGRLPLKPISEKSYNDYLNKMGNIYKDERIKSDIKTFFEKNVEKINRSIYKENLKKLEKKQRGRG